MSTELLPDIPLTGFTILGPVRDAVDNIIWVPCVLPFHLCPFDPTVLRSSALRAGFNITIPSMPQLWKLLPFSLSVQWPQLPFGVRCCTDFPLAGSLWLSFFFPFSVLSFSMIIIIWSYLIVSLLDLTLQSGTWDLSSTGPTFWMELSLSFSDLSLLQSFVSDLIWIRFFPLYE